MSADAQYMTIEEVVKKYGSMAIQDDFDSWAENEKHREVSKLLLIDQMDFTTQHLFFDDCADDEDACIVDVRDVCTKKLVS